MRNEWSGVPISMNSVFGELSEPAVLRRGFSHSAAGPPRRRGRGLTAAVYPTRVAAREQCVLLTEGGE